VCGVCCRGCISVCVRVSVCAVHVGVRVCVYPLDKTKFHNCNHFKYNLAPKSPAILQVLQPLAQFQKTKTQINPEPKTVEKYTNIVFRSADRRYLENVKRLAWDTGFWCRSVRFSLSWLAQ